MGFVQVIRIKTSRFDEAEQAHERWLAATVGRRTATRETLTKDRDADGVYWMLVEFPDHDAAMQNSALAETGEIAQTLASIADEPLQFLNLDVLRTDS